MNRIILIGNGFDLAHDLKTSYNDFLNHIWKEKIDYVRNKQEFYDPKGDIEFIDIPSNILGVEFYKFNGLKFVEFKELIKSKYGVRITFNNKFLETITKSCYLNNWVDVEKEYYSLLKNSYSKQTEININQLNKNFNLIKDYLKEYLLTIKIDETKFISELNAKVYDDFNLRDLSESFLKGYIDEKIEILDKLDKDHLLKEKEHDAISNYCKPNPWPLFRKPFIELIQSKIFFEFDLKPDLIFILNFNYTNTTELYYKQKHNKYNVQEVHIHGEINNDYNPIIFGFGDEIDEDYSKIENLDDNRYLENIKSTRYHETDNYKKLLEYIDSDYFQIFIFGHSCGLSDRTLLSTLFNHQNCVSIKPFYHRKKDGTDNYSDLVRNISRHFKDKAALRDKVVNKTYCEPLRGA